MKYYPYKICIIKMQHNIVEVLSMAKITVRGLETSLGHITEISLHHTRFYIHYSTSYFFTASIFCIMQNIFIYFSASMLCHIGETQKEVFFPAFVSYVVNALKYKVYGGTFSPVFLSLLSSLSEHAHSNCLVTD